MKAHELINEFGDTVYCIKDGDEYYGECNNPESRDRILKALKALEWQETVLEFINSQKSIEEVLCEK